MAETEALHAFGVLKNPKQWPKNWTIDVDGERYSGYGTMPDAISKLEGKEVDVPYTVNGKYKNITNKGVSEIKNKPPAVTQSQLKPEATVGIGLSREQRKAKMKECLEDGLSCYSDIFGPVNKPEEAKVVQAIASTFYIQERQDERDQRRR